MAASPTKHKSKGARSGILLIRDFDVVSSSPAVLVIRERNDAIAFVLNTSIGCDTVYLYDATRTCVRSYQRVRVAKATG